MRSAVRIGSACLALFVFACAEGGGDPSDLDTGPGGFDAGRIDAGPRIDAGSRDAGRPPDAGRRDAGPAGVDAGPPDSGPPPMPDAGTTCAPASANLAIVEVMVASASGSADRGEWFEVVNFGDCTVALTGMVIESPTST